MTAHVSAPAGAALVTDPSGDAVELPDLTAPVGVFDGGIGSYDLVRRIRSAFPDQDVVYLADRASFPYGGLGEAALLDSVTRAARGLVSLGATSIVLASNAPSVTVLDRLRTRVETPILGVTPPVRSALGTISSDGVLAVAGAGVMIESEALSRLVAVEAGADASRVVKVVADGPIGLVESGAFLDRERVRVPVAEFIAGLRARHPRLAGITLSSTHLPWLLPVLAEVAPDLAFFDPADTVVARFAQHATAGGGRLVCLATQSPEHPHEEFAAMIDAMGLDLAPMPVTIASGSGSGSGRSSHVAR